MNVPGYGGSGIVGGGLIAIIYQPSYAQGALQQDFLITQSGIDILTQASQEIIVELV
jgi:hypothetical protein